MNKKRELVRTHTSVLDVASLTKDALAAFAQTLPMYLNPIAGLLATGAVFSGMRVSKMGGEVLRFMNSKKAEKTRNQATPNQKLFETLRFLSSNSASDNDFVDALRNLHILSFADDTSVGDITELYMAIETARKLSGPEIKTLLAAYKIHNNVYEHGRMTIILEDKSPEINFASAWLLMIMRACSYSAVDYIERQEIHLEEERLIAPRNYDTPARGNRGNHFEPTKYCRLTLSGYKLADFIVRGDNLFNEI